MSDASGLVAAHNIETFCGEEHCYSNRRMANRTRRQISEQTGWSKGVLVVWKVKK